ncbi:DUF7266 family protein [Salinigranum marinum]|uniref:DUF7266 family protein n=1 Tax=Salinigranum marinum TaxID=1515595 RepID=UPI002989A063|nr:hypothetical protein [Salinigranum marinum]
MSRLRPPGRARRGSFAGLRVDDRAVSTALGYVLSLAIASILISGLMLAAGGFVEGQREEVIRSELEVVGETLVADVEGADRLASAVDGQVRVKSTLPRRVGSSAYIIAIEDGAVPGDTVYRISLSAASVDVSVTLRLVTNTPVRLGSVEGGELVVVSIGGDLEVRDA